MHSKPKCNKVREPNPSQGVNVAAAMLGTRKIWELTRLTNKMAKRATASEDGEIWEKGSQRKEEKINGKVIGTRKEEAT